MGDFTLLEMHQVSQVRVIRAHPLGGTLTKVSPVTYNMFPPCVRKAHLLHETPYSSILLFHE